ncbi:MAG: AAA family ATPase, partial [Rectinema sp.]
MFLKSLEIFGFKSFADRTLIEFSDGISALLGPNGCGKSNVVDAIKWVVGEQSPRSLRAESMEDIIFNGTETRKPLSVAEVTVTISNESGRLPLDVPEIAIKRRLYRSGESEYLINGRQAKLKEIRELFWDTGIGKSAYSVMEQGKIDQILSSKPEDRRYLFEEAAGITKHKVRSREAENKLERTEENMRQVAGILGEVKRSHDSLKSQADKTSLYRELRDRIFRTELDLHLLKLRQFLKEKERKDEEIAAKRKERDAAREESEHLGKSMSESLDEVNDMETELVELQKTLYGLAVEKNGKEKQRKFLDDRVRETSEKIDQSRMRMRGVEDKIAALREEEAEKDEELAGFKARLKETERNIA